MKDHEKEAHSEILGIRETCWGNARKIFRRCVLVGALTFLILSICIVILIPVEQQYWILLGLIPIVVSALIGEWYSQKEMGPFEESLESIAYECYYCGALMHRNSFPEHFRLEHGRIKRWMMTSFYLLVGIPVAISLLSAYIFSRYLCWSISDALCWSLAPGLLAAVVWAIVVEYLVMPRIEARSNE